MPNVADSDRKYVVPVLETAMRALEEIAEAGSLGLSEVVARTGAPKATAFRVLTTLRHLGYLGRDSRRRYFATSRLASLDSEDSVSAAVRQLCLPYMVRLRDEVGESVNLGRLQHELVRYVEVVPSEFALRLQETPGATVSLHATALGKAILAFSPPELTEALLRGRDLSRFTPSTVTDADGILEQLREVRRLGFARDAGESSPLAACVGAPILDAGGSAVAAMSVSGPVSRFDPAAQSRAVGALLQATQEISTTLIECSNGRGTGTASGDAPNARSRLGP